MTIIYKICERTAWRDAEGAGIYHGSAADRRDGFIHFSTGAQLAGTAAKHFGGQTDLVLVAVDEDRLGPALQWEPSRGGELFPHLYGALALGAVRSVETLADEIDGQRRLPELKP